MTEREIVDLVKEWKEEIKEVITDYNNVLAKLDAAVTLVEESKKKWWVVYRVHITTLVVLFASLAFIWLTSLVMKSSDLCLVNIGTDGKNIALQSCGDVVKQSEGNPSKN